MALAEFRAILGIRKIFLPLWRGRGMVGQAIGPQESGLSQINHVAIQFAAKRNHYDWKRQARVRSIVAPGPEW